MMKVRAKMNLDKKVAMVASQTWRVVFLLSASSEM